MTNFKGNEMRDSSRPQKLNTDNSFLEFELDLESRVPTSPSSAAFREGGRGDLHVLSGCCLIFIR